MLRLPRPVAITMWDFSWLERRWPGAGYESWPQALDALAERGYDAVRIDAYPHLLATDPRREWELLPCWSVLDWGAPMKCRVRDVGRNLCEFVRACRDRRIRVALSTWFRQDRDDVRAAITDAAHHARIWVATLELLDREGLLDAVLFVDLCNEWPMEQWAPFFKHHSKDLNNGNTPESHAWMRRSIEAVRERFPQLPCTFSFWPQTESEADFGWIDLFEPHVWMAQQRGFYPRFGYAYEKFDTSGLEKLAAHGERTYRTDPAYWHAGLTGKIDRYAALSRRTGRGLVTTECWGVVDYKDGPLLDWGWVKEVCDLGTRHAAATGRWLGVATSNFCGPQFHGMWRDVAWHQRLTAAIKSAPLDLDLRS